jgi:hypothetical protein
VKMGYSAQTLFPVYLGASGEGDYCPLGSLLLDEIETELHRLLPYFFLDPATQWKKSEFCTAKRGVRNSIWRSSKPEVLRSQLVDEIEKNF